VVVDTEPGGAQVTNTVASLPVGGVTNFTVVETAPGVGPLTNSATSTAATGDPNPGNNTNIVAVTAVTNILLPSADIAVFVTGPTNVTVGDGFSYTITVTNLGPSVASNTLAQDFLPTNLLFASASGGGVLSSNNVVTWPVIPSLANGQATNLILTVSPLAGISTNSYTSNPYNFIQTNTTPTVGFLTNSASAFSTTPDPNLTNNSASSSYTNAEVQTQIVPGVFSIFISTNTYPTNGLQGIVTNRIIFTGTNNLFIVGTSAYNPQTGLYEESVTVTNLGTEVVHALRLYVSGLNSDVTLLNATGTTNGVQYVEYDPPYNSTLYPPLYPYPNTTNSVTFALQFYVSNYLPFMNSLSAVAVVAPPMVFPVGIQVPITQFTFQDTRIPGDTRFLIGFTTIPGRTYTIEYTDDMMTWYVSVPSIVAVANEVQWYDDGPPETLRKPSGIMRMYKVIRNQ